MSNSGGGGGVKRVDARAGVKPVLEFLQEEDKIEKERNEDERDENYRK